MPLHQTRIVTFLKKNEATLEVVALTMLGALVFTWFGGPGTLLGVDSFFVLRPEIAVHDALSAWSTTASVGMPNFAIHTLPFYWSFALLARFLGLRAAETIVLWALVSASALGARSFLRSLFEDRSSYARWLIVLVAILYTFNPFTNSFVWWHRMWIEFTWATFPWLCAWLISAARGLMNPKAAAALGALVLVIAAPGYPHVIVVPVFMFLLALSGVLIYGSDDRKTSVYTTAFVVVWWMAAIAWWILPSTVFLHDTLSSWHAQYRSLPENILVYGSQQASLSNVLRFIGLLQLYLKPAGQPLVPWFTIFEGGAGIVLYAFPALAFSGIFFVLRSHRETSLRKSVLGLAAVTYILCIVLMKGGHEPLSMLNKSLLKLPLGAAWQHPYDKFALPAIMSAVALACYGALNVAKRLPNKLRYVAVGLCAIVVFVEGFPAFTGSVITPQRDAIPGEAVVVPSYYDDLQKELAGVNGFTLQLPLRDNGETAFAWERGAQTNNDPVLEYFNGAKPVVRMRTGYDTADAALDEANAALSNPQRSTILSALGFGDLVLHRDWNTAYMPVTPDISSYQRMLGVQTLGTPGAATLRARGSLMGTKLPIAKLDEGDFSSGFDVRIDNVAREQTLFSTSNGLEVRWVPPGYFALLAPRTSASDALWLPGQPTAIKNGELHRLNIAIGDRRAALAVDGSVVASGIVARDAQASSVFLGTENRYHRFSGEISDAWIINDARLSLFSARDPELLNRVRESGWTVTSDGFHPSALEQNADVVTPGRAGLKLPYASFDGKDFDVAMTVRLSDVGRDQVLFADSTGIKLRWVRDGYFELVDSFGSRSRVFSPPLDVASGRWFRIEARASAGVAELFLDDVPIARGSWSSGAHGAALFLGSANRFQPLIGSIADITLRSSSEDVYRVSHSTLPSSLLKSFGWRLRVGARRPSEMTHQTIGKLDLFLTPCPTPYVYTADGVVRSRTVDGTLAQQFRCEHRVAVVDTPAAATPCRGIRLVEHRSIDVSGSEIRTSGAGRCLLVFNTSFAQHWNLVPKSGRARVVRHELVNGYANAFLIETDGPASFYFRNQRQALVWLSAALGLIVFVASIALLMNAIRSDARSLNLRAVRTEE